MYYGMNEHNLIQVECENNSTVNIKKTPYLSFCPDMIHWEFGYFMSTICVEWA